MKPLLVALGIFSMRGNHLNFKWGFQRWNVKNVSHTFSINQMIQPQVVSFSPRLPSFTESHWHLSAVHVSGLYRFPFGQLKESQLLSSKSSGLTVASVVFVIVLRHLQINVFVVGAIIFKLIQFHWFDVGTESKENSMTYFIFHHFFYTAKEVFA